MQHHSTVPAHDLGNASVGPEADQGQVAAHDHADERTRMSNLGGASRAGLTGIGETCTRYVERRDDARSDGTIWRTRRSAAVAGIVFAVLLLVAMTLMRLALSDADPESLRDSAARREQIRVGLHLVPFAGIAFLWFIGVVRDQIGAVEDRLFSSVFLGSGLLFIAMMFVGAVNTASLITLLDRPGSDTQIWLFGRDFTQSLISVYAMRMAAVFTLSVSTLGLRVAAFPRWVAFAGYAAALVLLVAAGEHKWAQLVFPLWVLVLSIVILLTKPQRWGEPEDTKP